MVFKDFQYKNAIATKYEVESIWQKGRFFGRKRKIEGFQDCRKLSKGALYESSGHIIYDSIRKGGIYGDYVISMGPIFIDAELPIATTLEGRSAFIGNLFSQYGHFITEGLSRLYDFQNLNKYDHLLMYPFIHNDGKTDLLSYHKWFFEKLGIDHSKIKFINNTTRLESVSVFKQYWTINYSVNETIKHIYTYIRDLGAAETINGSKFFLSRRSFHRIDNLSQVEQIFEANGYQIVYPDEMNMDEQMAMYAGDNIIASFSGSSMHNVLFGNSRSKFIEIGDSRTPTEPHIMQVLANGISDASYQFIPLQSNDRKNWDLNRLNSLLTNS